MRHQAWARRPGGRGWGCGHGRTGEWRQQWVLWRSGHPGRRRVLKPWRQPRDDRRSTTDARGKAIDRNVVPRRIWVRVGVVVPMRIVPFVAWEVPPFSTVLIPQTLAADTSFAGAAGRAWRQGTIDRWMNALGRQPSGGRTRGRRIRLAVATVLFPGVVDSLHAAVGCWRRSDTGGVLREGVAYSGHGGSDFAGDLFDPGSPVVQRADECRRRRLVLPLAGRPVGRLIRRSCGR